MDRSADAVTVVLAMAVLLAATGSAVVEDTLAVLVSAADCAGAVTTTVIAGALAPPASVGRVQVAETSPELLQVHPLRAAETNVTPAGRVSVTETFAASEGPLFVTASV